MTTENDFQAALDANPDDWQTRLVFADWLEERGDPRAEGYRAMGKPRCRPTGYASKDTMARINENANFWCYWTDPNSIRTYLPRQEFDWLPLDWFLLIPKLPGEEWNCCRKRNTRRALEDAAALAFAKLPPERRAELLNPSEVAT